ncbi:MAG: regulatory protein RecX [Burkholderiaceae bacterium]
MAAALAEPVPRPADAEDRAILDEDKALKAHALAKLAQREYSRTELRRKLLALTPTRVKQGKLGDTHGKPCPSGAAQQAGPSSRGAAAAARIDAVLDWLEAHDYLSQRRFVQSRVRLRCERFGNLRIRQELAQHGVALPAQAEEVLRDTEFERAHRVWARKFKQGSGPAADTHKQARFLVGRGFSSDVIRRVLHEAQDVGAPPAAAQSPIEEAIEAKTLRGAHATLPR